jgi:hypothetical protein
MTQLASPEPLTSPTSSSSFSELSAQKQDLLLHLYRTCWEEMTWRRNAGYRTVILGLGYCGVMLAVVAYNHNMQPGVKACLAVVIALASIFGSGYLASNYYKYMGAMKRMVRIEEYVGAYDADFLGRLGALMPAGRRDMPAVPLMRNPVCIWSILAFMAGGLVTAFAVLWM